MPGQKQVYDQFMNLGHGFAWDQEWDKAIAAYARAVQEIPEDPESHKYLGLALLESRRYSDALKVYSRAHQLSPDDPVPLEKSADVLERLGRLKDAAQQYIKVADIYLGQQRDIEKAISNFERATLLTPGLLQTHLRLAQLYERTGRKRAAVMQYLILAFNFQRGNDKPKALQAIERALRLEPSNPQVLNARKAIESDALMQVPTGDEPTPDAKVGANGNLFPEEEVVTSDANPEGPLGEITEKALAHLAEAMLESGLSMGEAMVIQGIELQKIGENQAAVEAFQKAETFGVRHNAMSMCLGMLNVRLEKWNEAKKYLERAQTEIAYAGGAAHGLGQAYMGLDKPREAAEQLIRALHLTDTALAMNQDEAAQLNAVYDQLRASTLGMQDVDLNAMNAQFNRWLTGKDWKVRIPETRRALAERIRNGASNELRDYVTNTAIVDTITRIDKYIKQGMHVLALDEAYRAIEQEPTSLPAHQRIAQILMELQRTQEAITKYNIVANSYLARDDRVNAAAILDEVIKVAPMDTGLRLSLIELLEREGQEERVLEEYTGLANAYYALGETDQARDTFTEALKLAQKVNAPNERRAEIHLKLADIYMSRLDLRQAQRTYEQIRNLLPNDERPRKELIEINYRLNNPIEAIKELDGLLRLFATQKRGDQILVTLESMLAARTSDMALRSRLAAVYRQVGRKNDAIAQLDALGELQLEANMFQEACGTIKQIIQLGPSDITQYQTLLQQLNCG